MKDEIEKRLLSKSPKEVAEFLRQEGYPISERSLRNYRNLLFAPEALFRGGLFEQYNVVLGRKTDVLQELYNSIEILKERAAVSVGKEFREQITTSAGREDMRRLTNILLKTAQLEFELGIREKACGQSDDEFKALLDSIKKIFKLRNLNLKIKNPKYLLIYPSIQLYEISKKIVTNSARSLTKLNVYSVAFGRW